jgi:hypothetical protein
VETVLAILALTGACSCSSVLPHAYWTGYESYGLFQLQKNVYEIRHIPSYSRVVVQLIFNNLSPAILYTILLILALGSGVQHFDLREKFASNTFWRFGEHYSCHPQGDYVFVALVVLCGAGMGGALGVMGLTGGVGELQMHIHHEDGNWNICRNFGQLPMFDAVVSENLSSIIFCEFVRIYFTLQQTRVSLL